MVAFWGQNLNVQAQTFVTNTTDWLVYNGTGAPSAGWQTTWPTSGWIAPGLNACGWAPSLGSGAQKIVHPSYTGATVPGTTYYIMKFNMTQIDNVSSIWDQCLADDSVSLWINGQPIITNFNGAGSLSQTVTSINRYFLNCGDNYIAAQVNNTQPGCFFLENILSISVGIGPGTTVRNLTCQDNCTTLDMPAIIGLVPGHPNSSVWSDGTTGSVRTFCIPDNGLYKCTTTYHGCDLIRNVQINVNNSFTFTGNVSGQGVASCKDYYVPFSINNPENLSGLTYEWNIYPAGPTVYPDDDEAYVDFTNISTNMSYNLKCTVNYNGCIKIIEKPISLRCDELCVSSNGYFEKKFDIFNYTGGGALNSLQTTPMKHIEMPNDDIVTVGIVHTAYNVPDDIYVQRSNPQGKVIWIERLPNIVLKENNLFLLKVDIIEHQNHLYISTNGVGNTSQIIKLQDDGTFVWRKILSDNGGKTRSGKLIVGYKSNGSSDGIIFLGNSNKTGDFNEYLTLAKFDFNGNLMWEKSYENNYTHNTPFSKEIEITDVLYDASQNQYVAVGHLNIYNCYVANYKDVFLISFDRNGALINNTYINSLGITSPAGSRFTAYAIVQAQNGYIVSGTRDITGSSAVTAFKVSNNLSKVWHQGYRALGGQRIYNGKDIEKKSNGGGNYAILTHYTSDPYASPFASIVPMLFFINENGSFGSEPPKRYFFECRHTEGFPSSLISSKNSTFYLLNSPSDATNSNFPYYNTIQTATDANGNSTCSSPSSLLLEAVVDNFDVLVFTAVANQLSISAESVTPLDIFSGNRCCLDNTEFVDPKPGDPCAGVPAADFTFTKCGTVVSFTSNYSQGYNITWDFGDGSSSTAGNPVHDFPDFKVYTVCFTIVSGDCTRKFCKTVDLTINEFIEELYLCVSRANMVYSPSAAGADFEVFQNGVSLGNYTNGNKPALSVGTYVFYGKTNGCITSKTTVTVIPQQYIVHECYAKVSIPCNAPYNPELYDISDFSCPDCDLGPNATSTGWVLQPIGTASSLFYIKTYTDPDNCTKCVLHLEIEHAEEQTMNIAVKTEAFVDFINAMPCMQTAPPGTLITHRVLGTNINEQLQPTIFVIHCDELNAVATTVHVFEYQMPNGCWCRLIVNVICLASSENIGQIKYNVFPNPSNGKFVVTISEKAPSTGLNCYVYDIHGKVIKQLDIEQDETETEIDLTNYSNGTYYLVIKNGDKVLYTRSLIKGEN